MNEINNVNGVPSVDPNLRLRGPASAGTPTRAPVETGDSVEISEVAQLMGKLRSLPEIREDVVNQLRHQIESGTYETPQRIERTVEILLDELDVLRY